jgi:hypothetical protein
VVGLFKPVFKLLEKLSVVASIEAPFALLEKPIKVLLFDAVETAHVALGLVPEILDSIDVILLIGKELRVIDAAVMEVAHIKSIIGSENVGIDDAVGFHSFLDDGCKNLHAPFQKPKNGNFARSSTTSLAFARTSKIALICFNLSGELIAWNLTGNKVLAYQSR